MNKIEALLCTAWVFMWFVMTISAYNPERHSIAAVFIAWIFVGFGPVMLYRFLSR